MRQYFFVFFCVRSHTPPGWRTKSVVSLFLFCTRRPDTSDFGVARYTFSGLPLPLNGGSPLPSHHLADLHITACFQPLCAQSQAMSPIFLLSTPSVAWPLLLCRSPLMEGPNRGPQMKQYLCILLWLSAPCFDFLHIGVSSASKAHILYTQANILVSRVQISCVKGVWTFVVIFIRVFNKKKMFFLTLRMSLGYECYLIFYRL